MLIAHATLHDSAQFCHALIDKKPIISYKKKTPQFHIPLSWYVLSIKEGKSFHHFTFSKHEGHMNIFNEWIWTNAAFRWDFKACVLWIQDTRVTMMCLTLIVLHLFWYSITTKTMSNHDAFTSSLHNTVYFLT